MLRTKVAHALVYLAKAIVMGKSKDIKTDLEYGLELATRTIEMRCPCVPCVMGYDERCMYEETPCQLSLNL